MNSHKNEVLLLKKAKQAISELFSNDMLVYTNITMFTFFSNKMSQYHFMLL